MVRYDGFVGQYRDFVGHRWSDSALREENAIDHDFPPLVPVSIDHMVRIGGDPGVGDDGVAVGRDENCTRSHRANATAGPVTSRVPAATPRWVQTRQQSINSYRLTTPMVEKRSLNPALLYPALALAAFVGWKAAWRSGDRGRGGRPGM